MIFMIFAINKVPKLAWKNAAPAVIPTLKYHGKSAFTLLELMAVIVIIGILASLAYAGMIEMIFTNRAKETAHTMRTFAERALAEGKRQSKPVRINLDGNNISYYTAATGAGNAPEASESLSSGFSPQDVVPGPNCVEDEETLIALENIESEFKIGISGMATPGYFTACGARGYCAAAVKTKKNNFFIACIRRGASATWEAL